MGALKSLMSLGTKTWGDLLPKYLFGGYETPALPPMKANGRKGFPFPLVACPLCCHALIFPLLPLSL